MSVARFQDRALFPTLASDVYLNHAAVSPWSTPVQEAFAEVSRTYAAQGLGAVFPWVEQRERLRAKLAAFFGAASAEDIGFVSNTSQGVINVATCLPWSQGDRVVLLRGEFPTNIVPWMRAAELFGLELVWLDADAFLGDGLTQLEEVLKQGARLVAVSAVQFQTGQRMPVREMGALCRAHGAELFVDAIQAAGVVPIDVEADHIDYLTCGGHKWMMGVEGAGFLYIHERARRALRPHLAGWLSPQDPLTFLFEGAGHLDYDKALKPAAERFEFGAQNAAGYAALEASLDLLTGLGVAHIFAHTQTYLDALEPELEALGLRSVRAAHTSSRSAILSTVLPEEYVLAEVSAAMGERGVSISTPDGFLRFAPHWPNALPEVARVRDALAQVMDDLKKP